MPPRRSVIAADINVPLPTVVYGGDDDLNGGAGTDDCNGGPGADRTSACE
ncbi:hypothetical protein [Microbispora sp. KK1-11]|nr:hypothetical protein [Microbispora sp. KK1-11]